MRVIFTFDEIECSDEMVTQITNSLVQTIPEFSKKHIVQIGNTMKSIRYFVDCHPDQEVVKVDDGQKLVIFSIPEEVSFSAIKAVGELYSDLIDLIPAVMAIFKMVKKASRRYESACEKIAGDVNKLFGKKVKESAKFDDFTKEFRKDLGI